VLDLKERHSRWQLTENNPEVTKEDFLKAVSAIGTMTYGIASHEVGESGTEHIHCFVVYQNAIRGSSLKKAFPRAHLEVCRGSNLENKDYCAKQGDFIEQGEMPYSVTDERKRDIASEVLGAIVDREQDPIEAWRGCPEYADYIVRNFKNLAEIYDLAKRGRWRKK